MDGAGPTAVETWARNSVPALETPDFEAVVREHAPRLLATARRILRDEDDARDALQDAFLQAFRGFSGFHGGCRVSTWLGTEGPAAETKAHKGTAKSVDAEELGMLLDSVSSVIIVPGYGMACWSGTARSKRFNECS